MTASSGVASLLSRYRRRTQASSIAYTSADRPVPSSWPIRMRGTYWCGPRPGDLPHMSEGPMNTCRRGPRTSLPSSSVAHGAGTKALPVRAGLCGVVWKRRERSVRRFVGLRRSRRFLFFRPARSKGAVSYGHLDHGGGRRGDDRADRVPDSSAQCPAPASASASGALRPRSGRVRWVRGPGAGTGRVVPPVETVQPTQSLRKGEPRAVDRPGGSGSGE